MKEINFNVIKADVKPGYVVFNNNQFCIVNVVKDDMVTLSNGMVIPYTEAEENVVKFTATDHNKTWSVRHTDFELLVNLLNQEDKDPNAKYNTKAEALINGESVEVNGYVEGIFSVLRTGEIVRIKDIKVIDSLSLYDPNKRMAKVLFSGKGSVNIELLNVKEDDKTNRNKTLKVSRESIETTEHSNLFFLFRVACPYCKR